MKHVFVFDPDLCCGCSACMIGCFDQNDINLTSGDQCFRKAGDLEIARNDGSVYCAYLSAACMHCDDAPCITACPMGCIRKDPDTGFTIYDNTKCIGCRSCSLACPFGAPRYRASDGKMVKCDGCNIRVKNGLKPACVRACSFDALTCISEEAYNAQNHGNACNVLIRRVHSKK